GAGRHVSSGVVGGATAPTNQRNTMSPRVCDYHLLVGDALLLIEFVTDAHTNSNEWESLRRGEPPVEAQGIAVAPIGAWLAGRMVQSVQVFARLACHPLADCSLRELVIAGEERGLLPTNGGSPLRPIVPLSETLKPLEQWEYATCRVNALASAMGVYSAQVL